ncbi:MAG: Ppx/GppA family phosphatase [Christensenellaceae bacterium]|nr:Ppx/GppA family phosphatase [Christensenellaceae bacterium]
MQDICYVIDIGTNSARMMKARVDGERISREYKLTRTVRTGEGVHATHMLCEAAIERTVGAIREFAEIIKSEGGSEPYCFATSAVRDSKNAAEFVERVKNETGICVEILSGDEEARCGYAGAVGGGDGGIVDIGGGSTEVIFGKNGEIFYATSYDIGCVRALEWFKEDEEDCRSFARKLLRQVPYDRAEGMPFYAVGGTATSLAAVDQQLKEYDPNKVDGYVLTRRRVEELRRQMWAMSVEERRKVPGLTPTRAEIIQYGLSILSAFFEVSGRRQVTVRESDNLEGYLQRRMRR